MDGVEVERVLLSRLVVVPGGRDKEGRPLLLVTPPLDLASSSGKQLLTKGLLYALSVFNGETRHGGLTAVVEAQGSSWRQTRLCVRLLGQTLHDEAVSLLVVRPEAFWDKRVDHCTKLHRPPPQPVYIPLSRLFKYVEPSQLPAELGGTLEYDHDKWIQGRLRVERFFKMNGEVQAELERVCKILTGAREGNNNAGRTMTQTSATYNNTCQLANLLLSDGGKLLESYGVDSIAENIGQDVLDTRSKVEKQLKLAQCRQAALHQAWNALQKSLADAKEVTRLETGVRSVTSWILQTGEVLLSAHSQVGYDIASADHLRRLHENFELHCRETYGQYAEMLHQLDQSTGSGVNIPDDLKSQKDFMDFVCRSFATRLERRRNILITSARFFRLVSEYFQATSEVYEKLVMNPDLERLDAAHSTLLLLQKSQAEIERLEESVVREGEKLSDLLSMPVKDALGREVAVDYEADIVNIRDILEMTRARSELFTDSMDLQRITLQQASHVFHYENDAAQAIIWLNDLFEVMLECHCHVGCTVLEIQRQKEEHQAFQDTAKGTFEYGCQLLNAAVSLRQHSKLGEGENSELSAELSNAWERFSNVAHNQMTRLRVTAVLHRTLNQQCEELKELCAAAETVKGNQLRKLLRAREKLLIQVARMLRLARLLKATLPQPLCKQMEEGRSRRDNRSAVEAISSRVAEVTELADQLDQVLCSVHQGELLVLHAHLHSSPSPDPVTPPPPTSPQQQEESWWGRRTSPREECWWGRRISPREESCRSEEEFLTASECTCTPTSRSASFHTASEGEPFWPPSSPTHPIPSPQLEGSCVLEVKETRRIKLSPEGCSMRQESSLASSLEGMSGGREAWSPRPWGSATSATPPKASTPTSGGREAWSPRPWPSSPAKESTMASTEVEDVLSPRPWASIPPKESGLASGGAEDILSPRSWTSSPTKESGLASGGAEEVWSSRVWESASPPKASSPTDCSLICQGISRHALASMF